MSKEQPPKVFRIYIRETKVDSYEIEAPNLEKAKQLLDQAMNHDDYEDEMNKYLHEADCSSETPLYEHIDNAFIEERVQHPINGDIVYNIVQQGSFATKP